MKYSRNKSNKPVELTITSQSRKIKSITSALEILEEVHDVTDHGQPIIIRIHGAYAAVSNGCLDVERAVRGCMRARIPRESSAVLVVITGRWTGEPAAARISYRSGDGDK